MASTAHLPSPPAQSTAPTGELEPSSGVRRASVRWSPLVACVLLAIVGALVAMYATTSAGDRVGVLVMARDVEQGATVGAQDVTVVQLSQDQAVETVPAGERSSVVGKQAAVPLHKGGIVAERQVRAGGAVGADLPVVGVEVKGGQAPAGELRAGDAVLAVTVPAQGDAPAESGAGAGKSGAEPESVSATVVSVRSAKTSDSTVVNLAVEEPDEGPAVAARAAAKQLALVRQPKSEG